VRAFLPGMIERRHGRIVLCGSIAGWTGGLMSSPHYVASKGGIHALVRWFAQLAIGHGVCVNGVAPGPVATPMTRDANHDLRKFPLGRLAEPQEVAHAMVFLCSPAASYVSGTVVDVNGGLYMR
jgi:NAD(P)-dependent dehydrogenase (short-subunit alcohol dehydrogenase family)